MGFMRTTTAAGFGSFSFRTLGYMPAVRIDTKEARAKRESLVVANAFACLLSPTLTPAVTWSDRVKQIETALDAVAKLGAR